MKEIQYCADGPESQGDAENKCRNNCGQQQERKHDRVHKLFCVATDPILRGGLLTLIIGAGRPSLESADPVIPSTLMQLYIALTASDVGK